MENSSDTLKYPPPSSTTWFIAQCANSQTATCCIYSKKMRKGLMKLVPKHKKTRNLWIELLGDPFIENLEKAPRPQMVCKSHFICTHDGKVVAGALPRTEKYTHFMDKPKLPAPVESIILDDLSWDVYGLHSYSSTSKSILTGQYVMKHRRIPSLKCCICKNATSMCSMTYAPNDEITLRLWKVLLGESFMENVENTPPPQMVCKSHFICTHDGEVMPGALPRTEDYHHIMEKPKSWELIKPTILDDRSLDVYGLHSYCRISKNINSGQYVDDSKDRRKFYMPQSINRDVNGEKFE